MSLNGVCQKCNKPKNFNEFAFCDSCAKESNDFFLKLFNSEKFKNELKEKQNDKTNDI